MVRLFWTFDRRVRASNPARCGLSLLGVFFFNPFHWSFLRGMLAVSILCASGVTVSGKGHLRCDESGPFFSFRDDLRGVAAYVCQSCSASALCSFELLTDPAAALGQYGSILGEWEMKRVNKWPGGTGLLAVSPSHWQIHSPTF